MTSSKAKFLFFTQQLSLILNADWQKYGHTVPNIIKGYVSSQEKNNYYHLLIPEFENVKKLSIQF